jgi:hypothetical protein
MDSQTQRVKAHDRHLRALEMRKAGASYRQIAANLGYAQAQGAHKAVRFALRATLKEPAEELRHLEELRLDTALLAIWRSVQAGDLQAVDRLLGISKRRAELLGLAGPKRHEVSGPEGGPIEIDLSALSNEELAQLQQIQAKLDAAAKR